MASTVTLEAGAVQRYGDSFTELYTLPSYTDCFVMRFYDSAWHSSALCKLDRTDKILTDTAVMFEVNRVLGAEKNVITAVELSTLAADSEFALTFLENNGDPAAGSVVVGDYNTNAYSLEITTDRGPVTVKLNSIT